jgi:hypothetical protein
VLRPLLITLACAWLAACANTPSRDTELDYQHRPPSGSQGASGPSGENLTIQSGEGEQLNLPWFVRDTQEWINDH